MKKKKYFYLGLFTILMFGLIYYGITFAKYVADITHDFYLQSKGFYFTSDQLNEETLINYNNIWDGNSVFFNVKNYLNESVISTYDIYYDVICEIEGDASNYYECDLNDSGQSHINGVLSNFQSCINETNDSVDVSQFNKTECELSGYNWVNHKIVKDLFFNVIPLSQNYKMENISVQIKIKSTKPYKKKLIGQFNLSKSNLEESKIVLNYNNYSKFDELIISNSHDVSKCADISWDPNNIVLGSNEKQFNSYVVESNGYISGIKLMLNPKMSQSIIFYKKDFSLNYNVNEFTLTELDEC